MENAKGWSLGIHGSFRQPYKYVIVVINPPLQSQVPGSLWSRLLSLRKEYEKSCGTKKRQRGLDLAGHCEPVVVIKMNSRNAAVWVWWKSALMSCAAFEASFKLCQLDEAEFHPQGSVFGI